MAPFVGLNGMVMGVDEFGTSAPGEQVIESLASRQNALLRL